jgi:beta-galactosidase
LDSLRIFGNEVFIASVLPYTAYELDNAEHSTLLPLYKCNVVTLNGYKAGVGGDDSWGAQIHEEYKGKANNGLESIFYIKFI